MRLSGKTAVVTGAARGLGRAISATFAKEGADLVLIDVAHGLAEVPYPLGTREQLLRTAALCQEHGASVLSVEADVREGTALQRATADALDRFGRIDVLVNNAGIAAPAGRPVHEITEDEWQIMLAVNLSGSWRMIRHVGPIMLEQRAGSIVNVSSTAGVVGYRHFAGYTAAKHGLIGLTKAAALDYAPFKVRVNALCPGSVQDDTEVEGAMLAEIARCLDISLDEHEQLFVRDQPMNSLIQPDDVAAAAVWLAEDGSRQVTGSVITVDGGFSTR